MNGNEETPGNLSVRRAEAAGRIRRVADTLDAAFRLPGTGYRFGYDGLIGLIPGVGDLLGLAPLVYFMYIAREHNLPRRVHVRMIWNQLLDVVIGSVPVLGDLFDFAWKANRRNVRLFERAVGVDD